MFKKFSFDQKRPCVLRYFVPRGVFLQNRVARVHKNIFLNQKRSRKWCKFGSSKNQSQTSQGPCDVWTKSPEWGITEVRSTIKLQIWHNHLMVLPSNQKEFGVERCWILATYNFSNRETLEPAGDKRKYSPPKLHTGRNNLELTHVEFACRLTSTQYALPSTEIYLYYFCC